MDEFFTHMIYVMKNDRSFVVAKFYANNNKRAVIIARAMVKGWCTDSRKKKKEPTYMPGLFRGG